MFVDRIDAGLRLADALSPYRGGNGVLLAIPRGGVPVAAVAAKVLGLPMDILLVKKIGHPDQPELAIGAVSAHGTLLHPHFNVPQAYITQAEQRIRTLLKERGTMYRSGRPPVALKGRTVILVDDGIATGYTMRAAIDLVRHAGAQRVVVAVPVAAWQTVNDLRALADAVVAVDVPDDLHAIGAHYEDFHQVDDREVVEWLSGRRTYG